MLINKTVNLKETYKFSMHHFFIGVTTFLLFNKNIFIIIKNSIFPTKYTTYGKMLRNKIVYLKEIYKFSINYFFIEIIFFLLLKKKRFYKKQKYNFPAKIYEIRKNVNKQNS